MKIQQTTEELWKKLAERRAKNVEWMPGTSRATANGQRETILIIHGTFANPNTLKEQKIQQQMWWKRGGKFCEQLDKVLAVNGCAARCWAHLDFDFLAPRSFVARHRVYYTTFSWSGDNSEVARRIGAKELAEQLSMLERDPRVRRYHLIAHSHGGNVVRRAMRLIRDEPEKLGKVIYLGTPFLHFADEGRLWHTLWRIHWPLLLLLVAVLWFGWPYLEKMDVVQQWIVSSIFAGMGFCLYLYFTRRRENLLPPPGHSFCFRNDEAVALLKKCARIASEPEMLLRQFFEQNNEDQERKGWYRTRVWWNGSMRSCVENALRRLRQTLLIGGLAEVLGAICLLLLFRPYRPKLKLFLTSRLPTFRETFFYFLDPAAAPDDATEPIASPVFSLQGPSKPDFWDTLRESLSLHRAGVALAALASASVYVVILPLDWFFGVIAWLADVGSRMALWLGIKAATKTAFGMDVLGARFMMKRTGDIPDGVKVEDIPGTLEKEILKEVSASSVRVSEGLRGVLGAENSGFLVDTVKQVLSDVELLHARYYQDERIVAQIANLFGQGVAQEPRQGEVPIS